MRPVLRSRAVGQKRFDRKFGAELLRELPEQPAVYLFKDEAGEVLYAGKAKNIRRRIQGYRNASRRKAHRKMRALVREAHSLEVRLQPSEREALLAENELIRTLRPRFNVDGAYAFLYPLIGVGTHERRLLLTFTTSPEVWETLGLRWYGCFRPRLRALDAFDALVDLLARIGHMEPRSRLPEHVRMRGSRLTAFRQLGRELPQAVCDFLVGASDELLEELAVRLLEKPSARSDAAQVQDDLRRLEDFYRCDVLALRDALRVAGRAGGFVPQHERDALFIAARQAEGAPIADP